MSENGACSPGRWHVWQRSWTILTTSSLNVGASAADPTPDRASVSAIPISQMCFMISAPSDPARVERRPLKKVLATLTPAK
jgi:hypothetical protein